MKNSVRNGIKRRGVQIDVYSHLYIRDFTYNILKLYTRIVLFGKLEIYT